jgi:hypothetical protein
MRDLGIRSTKRETYVRDEERSDGTDVSAELDHYTYPHARHDIRCSSIVKSAIATTWSSSHKLSLHRRCHVLYSIVPLSLGFAVDHAIQRKARATAWPAPLWSNLRKLWG